MTRRFFSFAATSLLLTHAAAETFAQGCCTVGASSLGGLESGVQRTNTLSLALGYQSNSVTQAYQGTDKIADPLRRTAEVRYLTVQAEYGLMNGLSVLGSINYSDKTRELTVTTGSGSSKTDRTASFRGNGIGDLIVLVKYSVLQPTIPQPTGIAVGVGASLPTGSFTQEQNSSQLSIDLQPGTGATALLGWLFASHGFPELGLQFFLTSTYRYAGTNFDGYRLGDEILATLMAEKSITENYSGFVALRSRFAQKDFANRRFLIGTGGTYYDFMPGIGYRDGPSSLKLFGQLPVYRNVRGIQLALAYTFGVSFAYEFGRSE
jgi:hypothetical protein